MSMEISRTGKYWVAVVILVGNDPARDIGRKIVCVLIFERALYSSMMYLLGSKGDDKLSCGQERTVALWGFQK
jgi:hypothetical protein